MKKKSQVFTTEEIFDICKAYIIAETNDEEDNAYNISGDDILEWNDREEALTKIDNLSENNRKKFLNLIETVVQEDSSDFNSICENINTEEAFLEQQAALKNFAQKWENDFSDFIIQD